MAYEFDHTDTMALRSAVDLLSGCVSDDFAEYALGDYRHGGKRFYIAKSLYALIDSLEKGEAKFVHNVNLPF